VTASPQTVTFGHPTKEKEKERSMFTMKYRIRRQFKKEKPIRVTITSHADDFYEWLSMMITASQLAKLPTLDNVRKLLLAAGEILFEFDLGDRANGSLYWPNPGQNETPQFLFLCIAPEGRAFSSCHHQQPTLQAMVLAACLRAGVGIEYDDPAENLLIIK
jgi:hypothetical protein